MGAKKNMIQQLPQVVSGLLAIAVAALAAYWIYLNQTSESISERINPSARALRTHRTPEEIKRATMHTTNKAFERYFQIEAEDVGDIYRDTVVTFPPDNADKQMTRGKMT